jgi:hypothetical protein
MKQTHGGKRPGAGRPPIPSPRVEIQTPIAESSYHYLMHLPGKIPLGRKIDIAIERLKGFEAEFSG